MTCIEGMNLSERQSEAVLDGRPKVLVTAGAGSGKTRLLVASVVRELVEEELPVDKLVAVTFTRKAGVELESRIREALEGCGRVDLARSLDLAATGTIHSLCRRLVKDRALEAGVDPRCAVLEAEAAQLLKDEVSREAWELASASVDQEGLEVLASQGDALRREVVSLYDRLRGIGQDAPRVVIEGGISGDEARSQLESRVRAAIEAAKSASKITATLATDLALLSECLAWLERGPAAAGDTEGIDASTAVDLEIAAGFFPSRRTKAMEPFFGPVREALTLYRRYLAEARLRPLVKTMNVLLADFHRLYTARKRERGMVDFADLELKARALVAASAPGADSDPDKQLLPGSMLLVDEFQDTNELQCSILEGLGASRILMVGDERQSIYRFRGADVDVFRRREAGLRQAEAGDSTGGVHVLDVNYRSHEGILGFVNRLFGHEAFFGPRFVQLQAHPGREGVGRALTGPRVEVLVAQRRAEDSLEGGGASIQEAESEVMAGRIRRLIDEDGWQQRDIVVLLPAQTHVGRYQEALRAQGVDVYVVRGKGYYSQDEVADVVSLLRLVVNPHDDLALVSILRSPLVDISDDALYQLGGEAVRMRTPSLWDAIRNGGGAILTPDDRQSLEGFAQKLSGIRSRVGRPGLAKLVEAATDAYWYDVCLLAAPSGGRRFANVRKLMRLAAEYEALNGPDLAGFVELVLSMDDLGDREGSAPTLAESEDVVRVMTVHQAKGLEFPVVVLGGLGSDLPSGSVPIFPVGPDGRTGVFLKGSERANYETGDLCWGPADEIVAEERARESEEDVRVLYVAMTRAAERLILVGAAPKAGRADKSRVGRIVAALEVEEDIEPGRPFTLDGVDVVVEAVPSEATDPAGPDREPDGGTMADPGETPTTQAPACPMFLESSRPAGSSRRVSFSALADYQRCPRRFYLERILGLGDLGYGRAGADEETAVAEDGLLDPDERHEGRDVGLLVHALLERLAHTDQPPTSQAVRTAAVDHLEKTGAHISSAGMDRALALVVAFWESPSASRLGGDKAEYEVPFFFAEGETVVTGIMDLLWREAEHWYIVDYKTNALAGRTPAEVAAGYDLQAVVYCLAALRAGAADVQMDFVFLERPTEPVTVRFGRGDAHELERTLDGALEGLRAGRFDAQVGDGCERCGVRALCDATWGHGSDLGDGIE